MHRGVIFGKIRIYNAAGRSGSKIFSDACAPEFSRSTVSTANAAVDLPFGAWKASGIGPAEHGPANREFFTRMQSNI
jgi:acyl-CoA reductase-like NAD-dependent aldehyde dehydrogenase